MRLRTPDGEWMVDVIKLTTATSRGIGEHQEIRVKHYGKHEPTITTLAQLEAQPWYAHLIIEEEGNG